MISQAVNVSPCLRRHCADTQLYISHVLEENIQLTTIYVTAKLQEETLRHLSMNKIDPQLGEAMTERTWRWVYALKVAVAQYSARHNIPVEKLIPGHTAWGSQLLEQVMGDATTRRKHYAFIMPFHNVAIWKLMRLLSAFPYYTSESVLSVKDLRMYLEDNHYSQYVRVSLCFFWVLMAVLMCVGQVHMEVVRSGVEALHFIASDCEWPAMDREGRLLNPEGSTISPEVYAFLETSIQEAQERTQLMTAQEGQVSGLPQLSKAAATARQTAQTKFTELMARVNSARVVSEVFPKELLETFDKAYGAFLKDRIPFMADTGSPLWMDALRGYQSSIRTSANRYWTATLEKLRASAADSALIRALENAPQKLEWIFEMQRLGLAFALPFPTQTFMGDLRTRLVEADDGIATVSSIAFHILTG